MDVVYEIKICKLLDWSIYLRNEETYTLDPLYGSIGRAELALQNHALDLMEQEELGLIVWADNPMHELEDMVIEYQITNLSRTELFYTLQIIGRQINNG